MTDDRVVDIRGYLNSAMEDGRPGAFAVWGGEGERSRFALPVWRAIYLAGGDWGGLVFSEACGGAGGHQPHFILDLKQDPARTDCSQGSGGLLEDQKAPTLSYAKDKGLSIFLGEEAERRWYLLVLGTTSDRPPEGRARETLLFLAGECAGLLFFRELG